MNVEQQQKVREIFEKFLRNRIVTIRRLSIADLNINPFLVRLLAKQQGLDDPRSIVVWLLSQRLERGTVTSAGNILQAIAKLFAEGSGVEGADLLKTKRGRHYNIQLKSGPNTVDKDACEYISKKLRSAQRRYPGSITLFGMAYGNPEQISSIVSSYLDADQKFIGAGFWDFVADDPDCMREIYQIAGEVGEKYRDKRGQTLGEVLELKLEELVVEFESVYGKGGSEIWNNLFKHNS